VVEVDVHGLSELRAALLRFPQEFDRKVLNASLLKGAKLMSDKAKENAPILNLQASGLVRRTPGTIVRNIRARTGVPISGMTATVIVGVRRMSNKNILAFKGSTGKDGEANPDDPFYWRFMEFGYTDRGGKWHAGKRFLRNAFELMKIPAVYVIEAAMKKQIEKVAAKLGLQYTP
jgi:HK97 gp10 family phage protein